MSLRQRWSILTLGLVVAVLVAGWFLLVAPKRGQAAELRDQKVAQEISNADLRTKIQLLAAQAKELPKQEARLAQLRTQIPAAPALPAFIRTLTAAAQRSGADLISVTPAPPEPVTAGVAANAPAAPVAGAAQAPGGLQAIPVSIRVGGRYPAMAEFLNKLEGLKRAFLVTGLTLKYEKPEGAASQVVSRGPLDLQIQGRVYISAPTSATGARTVAAPGAAATPAPGSAAGATGPSPLPLPTPSAPAAPAS